jgi:hypothetical protein
LGRAVLCNLPCLLCLPGPCSLYCLPAPCPFCTRYYVPILPCSLLFRFLL